MGIRLRNKQHVFQEWTRSVKKYKLNTQETQPGLNQARALLQPRLNRGHVYEKVHLESKFKLHALLIEIHSILRLPV